MIELAILLFICKRNLRIIYGQGGELKENTLIYCADQYEYLTLYFFGKKIEVVREKDMIAEVSKDKNLFIKVQEATLNTVVESS